jgi:hypothetical protein
MTLYMEHPLGFEILDKLLMAANAISGTEDLEF